MFAGLDFLENEKLKNDVWHYKNSKKLMKNS